MSDRLTGRTDLPTEVEREVAPDMLAELGPLAYGLFALGQDGSLGEVRTLAESRAAQMPAQVDRSSEKVTGSGTLLDELGELDL